MTRLLLTDTERRWLCLAGVTVSLCAVVLLVVCEDVIRRSGVERNDRPWLDWVVRHRGLHLERLSRLLAVVGSVKVLLLLGVLVAVVLWECRLPLAHCLAPIVALLGAGFSVAVLKTAVGRLRPEPPIRLLADIEPSFPSGHSADSTALFVTLALVVAVVVLRRPLARILTVGAAALLGGAVGASRLVLGVHWPTDVIGGLAIGLAAAVTAIVLATSLTSRSNDPPGPGRLQQSLRWARLQRPVGQGEERSTCFRRLSDTCTRSRWTHPVHEHETLTETRRPYVPGCVYSSGHTGRTGPIGRTGRLRGAEAPTPPR